MPTEYYKKQLESGLVYQDFVYEVLARHGIMTVAYGSKLFQQRLGAQRRVEARIGQLLGTASHIPGSCQHADNFHTQNRVDFRILSHALSGDCELTADEKKLDDQEDFVNWWRDSVRGKGKKSNNSDPGYFVEDAERHTGITQQQVSKWNKRLAKRDEYRAALYGVAYRQAMGALQSLLLDALHGRPCRAVVERVGAMPRQGVASSFAFGVTFGSILATQTLQLPIELVTAATWKSAAGLGPDKNGSLDRARPLYPAADLDRKRDHGRAEALLIAYWALSRRPAA